MTIQAVYRALEQGGRAVLVGTNENPEAWLTPLPPNGYALCSTRTERIVLLKAGEKYPDAVKKWIVL